MKKCTLRCDMVQFRIDCKLPRITRSDFYEGTLLWEVLVVLWRIQYNLPHQHFPNRVISHSLFVSFDLYLILVQIVETETNGLLRIDLINRAENACSYQLNVRTNLMEVRVVLWRMQVHWICSTSMSQSPIVLSTPRAPPASAPTPPPRTLTRNW